MSVTVVISAKLKRSKMAKGENANAVDSNSIVQNSGAVALRNDMIPLK